MTSIDALIQSYADATCAVETALREIAAALQPEPKPARPEWVTFRNLIGGKSVYPVRKVTRWEGNHPVVDNNGAEYVYPDDAWEPASPPAPAPTPAMPKVDREAVASALESAWRRSDPGNEFRDMTNAAIALLRPDAVKGGAS